MMLAMTRCGSVAAVAILISLGSVRGFVVHTTQQRKSPVAQHRHHVLSAVVNDNADDYYSTTVDDRRSFLTTAAAAASLSLLGGNPPAYAEDEDVAAAVDYKAVSSDIAELIKKNPDWGPTMIRVAWHCSGTYDKDTKTGGSMGGTIRFPSELAHGGNAGLGATAVPWLDPIYKKYEGKLSHGDLYTLAGVTAIKEAGGPIIPWSSGRVDTDEDTVTPEGRLPNAETGPEGADRQDAAHLRSIFNRMGFNDKEIVCLSGAHALGRCHTTASGFDGPWTPTPTTFNNAYYTILSSLEWIPKEWDGPFQYVDAPTGKLMMLPTDLVLLKDKSFKKWVKYYAKNGDKFNEDFTVAFQTLEELGCTGLVPTEWA